MKRLKMWKWLRNENGSYTLESALLFPVLFAMTLFLVFAGLYVYHQVAIYFLAASSSQQAAHYWTNSHADPRNGRFVPGQYDGLYWRFLDDNVGQIIGLKGGSRRGTLVLPAAENNDDRHLPRKKLANVSRLLPQSVGGQMQFFHRGITREVEAQLHAPFASPSLPYFSLSDQVQGEAGALISEPVEFLRLLQLATTYVEQLRKSGAEPEEVQRAYDQFLGKLSQGEFMYHDETIEHGQGAEKYLRQMLEATGPHHFSTSHGERRIDALDEHGIAHQAYLTFTESQLLNVQMPKDIELLETGKVNGVVWHFFRREGQTGRVGPSDTLRRELEKNGIVVVIHD
jgi:hypothetical protein